MGKKRKKDKFNTNAVEDKHHNDFVGKEERDYDGEKMKDPGPVEGSDANAEGISWAAVHTPRSRPEANLGCASTEEIFRELIVRFIIPPRQVGSIVAAQRACQLAEMLGELEWHEKYYRTIDERY